MKTSVQEVVCWTLLHFLWQATAIAVLYKCADWCLPSIPARKRYALALIALLAMCATAIGTAGYEAFRIASYQGLANAVPLAQGMGSLTTEAARVGWSVLSATLSGKAISFGVAAAWSFGVLVMSIRALSGLWFLARLRASRCVPTPKKTMRQLSALRERMNITAQVGIRVHAAISGPFVIGALRPVIYVPLSFLSGLTSEQVQMILAHELAHVARVDYVWNMFQVAMETLFFFHPAVWWIGRVLRDQREHSCDDIVLEAFAHPTTYATALLALAEYRNEPSRFAMGLAGHNPSMQLLPRIARILGNPIDRSRQFGPSVVLRLSIPVMAGVALLCCTLATPIAGLSLDRPAEVRSQNPGTSETRDMPVRVTFISRQQSRAVASHAKSIAAELAPKRASERATEPAAPTLADDHIAKMRPSPSIAQISPSAMKVYGTVIDARALAEQAIAVAVEEQLKLHPEMRLDEDLDQTRGRQITNTKTQLTPPLLTKSNSL